MEMSTYSIDPWRSYCFHPWRCWWWNLKTIFFIIPNRPAWRRVIIAPVIARSCITMVIVSRWRFHIVISPIISVGYLNFSVVVVSLAAIFGLLSSDRPAWAGCAFCLLIFCRENPRHECIRILLRIIRIEILRSRDFFFVSILKVCRVWDVISVPIAKLWYMCRLLQMPIIKERLYESIYLSSSGLHDEIVKGWTWSGKDWIKFSKRRWNSIQVFSKLKSAN